MYKKIIILITIFILGFGAHCIWKLNTVTTIELAIFGGNNWGAQTMDSYSAIDEAISLFEEQNPRVKVHYTSGILKEDYAEWLGRKILSGNEPDVMVVLDDDFVRFSEAGLIECLDGYINGDLDFDESVYYQTTLNSGRIDGRQYALPFETVPRLMFVNRTLLNRERIDIPDGDYTFDELYEICERVTRDTDMDGKLDQFGIYQYGWQEAAIANGVRLFSEDGRVSCFDDQKFSEAVKFVKRLHKLEGGESIKREDFDDGRVAFMPLSYAQYRTYRAYPYKIKKYTDFVWDCIPMPAGDSGGNISEIDTLNLSVGSMSKNKELAWKLIKFLTTDETVQKNICINQPVASVLKSVMLERVNGELVNATLMDKVLSSGVSKPRFEKYSGAMQIADSEINKIYESEIDTDSALRLLQRNIQDYLIR